MAVWLEGIHKERRRRTPADVALVSEGLQLRNRSGWGNKQKKPPAGIELRRGAGDWDG